MNMREAKRLVLRRNGYYLLMADHFGLSDAETAAMPLADQKRVERAQQELARELISRAGELL